MTKSKQLKRVTKKDNFPLHQALTALDMVLAGHETIIGPDFIVSKHDPYNADIGHLDRSALRTFDQKFVNHLIHIKPSQKILIPGNIKNLTQDYLQQRDSLSDYNLKAGNFMFDNFDVDASKELGNFDPYLNKVVIRNEAEMCVFYDYIALYRKIGSKRTIISWREQNKSVVNEKNKQVISALENANFAVLRIDKNLDHGAIKVTDIIREKEYLLIDRALNYSRKEGCFFICSVLNMGDYIMTSGGGTPISPATSVGKSTLTLLKKHLVKIRSAKRPANKVILECVREIFGFCLRSGALEFMTIK